MPKAIDSKAKGSRGLPTSPSSVAEKNYSEQNKRVFTNFALFFQNSFHPRAQKD